MPRSRGSEALEGASGSQRDREKKLLSVGERSHHDRHGERHKYGNERGHEQGYYESRGHEGWDQFDPIRGRDPFDHRWRLHDGPWDVRKGQPGYDLPRNWMDHAYSHEKAIDNERRLRASDRSRDIAFDVPQGPRDIDRHGRRDRAGNPGERGRRR